MNKIIEELEILYKRSEDDVKLYSDISDRESMFDAIGYSRGIREAINKLGGGADE